MSKQQDDWIHGRVVLETEGRDIIIRPKPIEGEPTPTGEVIRLRPTGAQIKHMRGDGKPVGPKKLALELGLRRGLKLAGIVGGTALTIAGAAVLKGAPVTVALQAAALIAGGSAIAGGAEKTIKEFGKQTGKSKWEILGGIVIEVIKLIRELIRKEDKK